MLTAFSNDVTEQQSVSSNKTEGAPLNESSPMHSSDKIEYLENTDPLQSCKGVKSLKSFLPAPSKNETGVQLSSHVPIFIPKTLTTNACLSICLIPHVVIHF